MCRNNGFVHDRILKVFPHITWWISNKYGTVYFDLRFLAYKNPILSIQDGGSLLLQEKWYSGTTVRRNFHFMCATILSSCRERHIHLNGHFRTGKLSAQTAEVRWL